MFTMSYFKKKILSYHHTYFWASYTFKQHIPKIVFLLGTIDRCAQPCIQFSSTEEMLPGLCI